MDYLVHLSIMVGIYAVLALGLNLVVGYAGLLSIAQASFYGIGAYAVAILGSTYGLAFFPALLIGIGVSMAAGLLIGLVLSRFSGDYYAFISLGFNVIVWEIMLNWQSLTNGALGIAGISRPEIAGFSFDDNLAFLLLVLAFLACSYAACRAVAGSYFGRALKAIREDEGALQVFGYRTAYFKLIAFVASAGLAALAGGLFASYVSYIDPSTFTVSESIVILGMVILGGLASLPGSLIGAAFLVLLPEALRFAGFSTEIAAQMRQLIYGLLLILLMLYRPQGIKGEYKL